MSVGQYISHLADSKGLSQSEMARKCGITRQALNYIVSGERKMTLPQALRLESLFSLKSGTLVRMQEEDAIRSYKRRVRHNLLVKLEKANAFWSYSEVDESSVSDDDIVEKTFIHLDLDDISYLFELYSTKFIRRVWEERMAGQGEYLWSLNMMIAQCYFGIHDPERFLRRKEREHINKAIGYAAGIN